MITAHNMCFILHLTNIIIKLIGHNEIPGFKYLNQAFFVLFLSVLQVLPNYFSFCGVSLLKPKNENTILPI